MKTPFANSLQIPTMSVVVLLALFGASTTAIRADTLVSGDVSGTWTTNGSPYIVQSNSTVLAGTALTIEPGVVVRFQTNVGLTINGVMDAQGSESGPIVFTSLSPSPKAGDWIGIKVSPISGPNISIGVFNHCVIQCAVGGIKGTIIAASDGHRVATVAVRNTTLELCSEYGLDLLAIGSTYSGSGAELNLTLSGCQVRSNNLSGVRCAAYNGLNIGAVYGAISNCCIFANGGHGIEMSSTGNTTTAGVVNNSIYGNTGDGLSLKIQAGQVMNKVMNNIVVGNSNGITASGIEATHVVTYNDVWGNATNWGGAASQFASTVGNISADPLFANPEAGDFHLRSQVGRYDPVTGTWVRDAVTSPCIDAGEPALVFASEGQPNGGRINMGAFGGTPFASMSLPRITQVFNPSTRDVVLSWGCLPAESYQVLYGPGVAGPWRDDLPASQMTAGAAQTTLSYTNASVSLDTNRFYRVRWNTP